MVMSLRPEATVGELVADQPGRARVFERFEIDYCCGGKARLVDACRDRGLDPDAVLEHIRQADAVGAAESDHVDARAMTPGELIDHIEQVHHAYLREALPRLEQMTEKVARVHGGADGRLDEVRDAMAALSRELISHMGKEEQILFPMIRELAGLSGGRLAAMSVAEPIRQMEGEHDTAGDALATLRRATDGFEPPRWACNTYRAMLYGLAELERDMHRHVHEENNVLFPAALRCEAELAGKERI